MVGEKIIMLLILIILVGGILFLYSLFNGNFIGSAIAKAKINKYIENTYPEKDFMIYDMFYNFKFCGYGARVKSNKDGLNFSIEAFGNGRVYDYYKESPYLADIELEDKFSKIIEEELKNEFRDILNFDTNTEYEDYLFANVIVKQGKYKDKTIDYNREMNDFIEIQVSTNNKEKALEVARKMKEVLLKNSYNGLKLFSVSYHENDITYVIALEKNDLSSNKKIEEFLRKGTANLNWATGEIEFQGNVMTKEEELKNYNEDLKIKD